MPNSAATTMKSALMMLFPAITRERGQQERPVEPEPRDAEDREKDGTVLAHEGDRAARLGERIPADAEPERLGRCRRHPAADGPPGEREQEEADRDERRTPSWHRD